MYLYGPKQLTDSIRTVRKNTILIAEDIPEEQYGYRPTADSRSVAENLIHIAMVSRLDRILHEEEHVTTLAYLRPDLFRIDHILHSEDLSHLRWTVDTQEDLELVRLIFQHFGGDGFSWKDVIPVLAEHPGWSEINQAIPQKTIG